MQYINITFLGHLFIKKGLFENFYRFIQGVKPMIKERNAVNSAAAYREEYSGGGSCGPRRIVESPAAYREEYRYNSMPYDPESNKLQFRAVFHSWWKAGYVSEKMSSVHAIYSLTLKGTSYRVSKKHEVVHSKGCFSWGRSLEPFRREEAAGDEDILRKSILIHQNAFHELISSHFFQAPSGLCPLSEPGRVEEIFDELYEEIGKKTPDEAVLAGLFFRLLCEVKLQEQKNIQPHSLTRVLDFIARNLDDPELSRTSIAEACGMSVRTLTRQFKKIQGVSVMEYVNNVRLSKVCGLLTLPQLSIKEIAAQCGFRSAGFLSLRFKQRYGKTPRAFRFYEK